MSPRHFATDAEIDAWSAEHYAMPDDPRAVGNPDYDQAMVSSRDLRNRFENMALHSVARGESTWTFLPDHKPPTDLDEQIRHPVHRSIVRMYLAAQSAGVVRACPHTDQRRPRVLMCDPPAVFCVDCSQSPALFARLAQLGHLYDHECDACGAQSELMTETMTMLGDLALAGHVCDDCAELHRQAALADADIIQRVGRNLPCPCGSGVKYKRCHGRPAA